MTELYALLEEIEHKIWALPTCDISDEDDCRVDALHKMAHETTVRFKKLALEDELKRLEAWIEA